MVKLYSFRRAAVSHNGEYIDVPHEQQWTGDVGDATRRGFSVLIHTFEGQFPFFGAKDYLLDVLLNILEFLVLGFYRNTK